MAIAGQLGQQGPAPATMLTWMCHATDAHLPALLLATGWDAAGAASKQQIGRQVQHCNPSAYLQSLILQPVIFPGPGQDSHRSTHPHQPGIAAGCWIEL